jgi:hypothetical protein
MATVRWRMQKLGNLQRLEKVEVQSENGTTGTTS